MVPRSIPITVPKAFVLLLLLVGKSGGGNEEYEEEEGEHRSTHFQLLDTFV